MASNSMNIRIGADASGVDATLNGVSEQVGQFGQNLNVQFQGAARGSDSLFAAMKGLKSEATSHKQVFGFYGGQIAQLAAGFGVAGGETKAFATHAAGLAATLASGMWLGAGISAAQILIGTLREMKEESKKLSDEAFKQIQEAEKRHQHALATLSGKTDEEMKVKALNAQYVEGEKLLRRQQDELEEAIRTQAERTRAEIEAGGTGVRTATDIAVREKSIEDIYKSQLLLLGQIGQAKSLAAGAAEVKSAEQIVADAKKTNEKIVKDREDLSMDFWRIGQQDVARRQKLEEDSYKELKKLQDEQAADEKKASEERIKSDIAAAKAQEDRREASAKRGQKLLDKERADYVKHVTAVVGIGKNLVRGLFSDILNGASSITEVLTNLFRNMAMAAVDALLEMAAQEIITSIVGTAAAKGQAVAEISAASGEAFANTYASISAIPIIGPGLAPAAAAAAGAATKSGGLALAMAERGALFGPGMPGLLQAHPREMVLPADISEGMQGLIAERKGGKRGGGDVHLHVNSPDRKGVSRLFTDNQSDVNRFFKKQRRYGRI